MKKLILWTVGTAVALQSHAASAALTYDPNYAGGLEWAAGWLEEIIVRFIGYLVTFLYLVAVVIAIYGWFTILTAAWDDEKVSKWRKIIFQAIIGLIVIFLAEAIIGFVVSFLLQ